MRHVVNGVGSTPARSRSAGRVVALLALLLATAALAGCGASSDGSSGSSAKAQTGVPARTTATTAERAAGQAAIDQAVPELRAGLAVKVQNLDDSSANGSFGSWLSNLALETLVVIGPDGKLRPWLAESFEQKSDTVWEYKLRDGVTFSDGTPLTAEDVKFSWEHYAKPASRAASWFAPVKKIETPDERTVVVTLKQPNASWQWTPSLTFAQVFSKKFYEEHAKTFGAPGTLLVGTGPWKFDSLNPTSGAELSANPRYWGGKVPFDKVSFKFFADENAMALAMRAGELDIVPHLADKPAFTAASGGVTLTSGPSCQTGFVSMPTKTAPWNDIHVRRAVAHLMNRDDVVSATGFAADPATTLFTESQLRSLGSEQEVDTAIAALAKYDLDVAAAKAELAKSKYPDGFDATLKTFDYGTFLKVDQVIAEALKQIGIKVKIDNIGQAAWFAAIGDPKGRPFTYTTTGGCTPDPSYYKLFLGSDNLDKGGLNVADWAPKEVDQLLDQGLATSDPAQRLKIYAQVLDRMATDVPYIPLYVQGVTFASDEYTWPGYDGAWHDRVWPLELQPKG